MVRSSQRFRFSQNFWHNLWVGGFWNAKAESPKPPQSIAWGKLKQTKAETQFLIHNRRFNFSDHGFWWTVQSISVQLPPLLRKIQSVWMSVVHCILFFGWQPKNLSLGDPASHTCSLKHHLQKLGKRPKWQKTNDREMPANDREMPGGWPGNAGQWSGNATNDREMPPPTGSRGFWTKFVILMSQCPQLALQPQTYSVKLDQAEDWLDS